MGVLASESNYIDIALQPLRAEDHVQGDLCVPNRPGQFHIGRAESCEIRVDHPSISARHAILERREDGVLEIADLGSSNGTFLNGERVDRGAVVRGDSLRFADVEFRVISREGDRDDLGSKDDLDSRTADGDSENEELRTLNERNRKLQRELDDARLREEKIRENLNEARRIVIEKEGEIAHLSYQLKTTEGALKKAETRCEELEIVRAESITENSRLKEEQGRLEMRTQREREARDEADRAFEDLLNRLKNLASKLLDDWKDWFSDDRKCDPRSGADEIFTLVEEVARKIRGELDLIEPIWHTYGAGVEAELKDRCGRQQEELSAVESELDRRSDELRVTREDLKELHRQVDEEIRRVQAMNRSGLHLEIPQRFEAMVIPRDREQEVCRALITQVDFLSRFIENHQKGNGLRGEVAREMSILRDRLTDILSLAGVEEFQVKEGLVLAPAHRLEVQILEKKGWGVREFIEKAFQPGEVTRVLRPGYRMGTGDERVILRRVEVLIRNLEKE